MARKDIKITIASAFKAAGVEASESAIARAAKAFKASMAGMARMNRTGWADIKAAWDMGLGMIRKAAAGMKTLVQSAFKYETQTRQFKTLIGDIDEARRHMQDLKELGDTPPFSLDEFAAASRSLMVMSEGALGYKESLKTVGDAAAATGVPLETMSHAIGYLYAAIRDGKPLSRATMQLQRMGVLTPEVAAHLNEMQKAGAKNADIWGEVETALKKHNGAMAETETTGNGLIGAIQSQWDNIVRKFGEAFMDAAKDGVAVLLDWLKRLQKDGSVDVWASRATRLAEGVASAFNAIVESVRTVAGWFRTLKEYGQAVYDAAGATWDYFQDGGFDYGEAMDAAKAAFKETREVQKKAAQEAAEYEAQVREDGARKAAEEEVKAEVEAAGRVAKEKERIDRQMAEGQKRIDERKAAEKEEKSKKKSEAAEKRRKERAARDQANTEIKAVKKAHDAKMKAIEEEIKKARKLQDEWQNAANRAQGAQSFGHWLHQERAIAREQAKDERRRKFNLEKAQEELAALDALPGAQRTKWQQERARQLRDFIDKQNDANNPGANQVGQLEEKKARLMESMESNLDSIRTSLESNLEKLREGLEVL